MHAGHGRWATAPQEQGSLRKKNKGGIEIPEGGLAETSAGSTSPEQVLSLDLGIKGLDHFVANATLDKTRLVLEKIAVRLLKRKKRSGRESKNVRAAGQARTLTYSDQSVHRGLAPARQDSAKKRGAKGKRSSCFRQKRPIKIAAQSKKTSSKHLTPRCTLGVQIQIISSTEGSSPVKCGEKGIHRDNVSKRQANGRRREEEAASFGNALEEWENRTRASVEWRFETDTPLFQLAGFTEEFGDDRTSGSWHRTHFARRMLRRSHQGTR